MEIDNNNTAPMETRGSLKKNISLSWISHMPSALRDYVPTDSDLRKLVKCFGGDWKEQKRVFCMLGFLDGHIHRFMKECTMQSDVLLKILFAWKYESWGENISLLESTCSSNIHFIAWLGEKPSFLYPC